MTLSCILTTILLTTVTTAAATSLPPYTCFHPGSEWLDTDGAPIRAHSAGLLSPALSSADRAHYWYGADNYTSGDGTNVWINVYQSDDLMNWRNLGHAYTHPGPFKCSSSRSSQKACGEADRPKVARHPSGYLVMVVKSSPAVSFAKASTEAGPFAFQSSVYPNGNWVGDLTVFVDPESPADAYLVYSVRPNGPNHAKRQIVIAKLTKDWLGVESEQVSGITNSREGPAVFYGGPGVGYFLWTSHVTGWSANAAAVYHADSITSQTWTALADPNPTHNATSFSSQSTYILPVNGSFIYVADRFEPYVHEKVSPRYVWLPITNITKTGITVNWHDEWRLPEQNEQDEQDEQEGSGAFDGDVDHSAGSRDPPAPTCHECALAGNCAPAGPYCLGCSYDPAVSGYCMNGGCCCNC